MKPFSAPLSRWERALGWVIDTEVRVEFQVIRVVAWAWDRLDVALKRP
jgi:hypothetical protein